MNFLSGTQENQEFRWENLAQRRGGAEGVLRCCMGVMGAMGEMCLDSTGLRDWSDESDRSDRFDCVRKELFE